MYHLIAFHFNISFFFIIKEINVFGILQTKNRNVRSEEVLKNRLLIEVKYFIKHSGGKYGS